MTNQHITPNQPTTSRWDGHNVIAVSFDDDHEAYHALSLLKELDSQLRVGVREAAVVVRGVDGQLVEKDRTESAYLAGTASGGLIGLMLGIIGGPLGVLIGGATGLMVGSLYDLADTEDTDSALGAISSSVPAGRTPPCQPAAGPALGTWRARGLVQIGRRRIGTKLRPERLKHLTAQHAMAGSEREQLHQTIARR